MFRFLEGGGEVEVNQSSCRLQLVQLLDGPVCSPSLSTAWNANEAGGAGQLLWVAEAPLTG